MLVGAEFIGNQLGDSERRDLAALRPDVVKLRRPFLVSEVLDILPEVRILARSDGEGYDVGDVANSYDHWRDTLERYANRILAYEIANEVNAKQQIDPDWWVAGVAGWLASLEETYPVPFATPGLVPNVRIGEWRRALGNLPVRYRGVHCYWQQNGPEAAVQEALAQASGADRSAILCTEFNSAGATIDYQPTIEQRADECCRAMLAFAAAGIHTACLFSLTPWTGGDWSYWYPVEMAQTILAAGRAKPKRPKPKPKEPPPMASYPMSPNHGGARPRTDGVVIHSTRGGAAYGREFDAAVNWFANPASQVSAHAIIGRDGRIAYPVGHALIAWHARTHNPHWLGIEFEQPAIDDDYTDEQIETGAGVVAEWCRQYDIPADRAHLRGHEEMPAGIQDGKSDPGPTWPWDRFVELVQAALAGTPEPAPIDPRIVDSFRDLLERHGGTWQADAEAIPLADGSWLQHVVNGAGVWHAIFEWPDLPAPERGPVLYRAVE